MIIDLEATAARRNPLTKEQEAAKKKALSKVSTKRIDQVYGMFFQDKCFYVGVTVTPTTRWKAHQRAIELGVDSKPAYETARHYGLQNVTFQVLDADGEFTEEEWRIKLMEEGHPLQNAVGGVDVKRKARKADKLRALLVGGASTTIAWTEKTREIYKQHLLNGQHQGNEWAKGHFNKDLKGPAS